MDWGLSAELVTAPDEEAWEVVSLALSRTLGCRGRSLDWWRVGCGWQMLPRVGFDVCRSATLAGDFGGYEAGQDDVGGAVAKQVVA